MAHTRRTGQFQAIDPAGRTHTIYIYSTFSDATEHGDAGSDEPEGSPELRTDMGEEVVPVGKGEYRLANGMVLRSTDPSAP